MCGEDNMPKNAIERVKLLKTGFVQKQIEKLYLEKNNFAMSNTPVIVELIEINENKNERTGNESPAYQQRMVCSDMKNLCKILRFEKSTIQNTKTI